MKSISKYAFAAAVMLFASAASAGTLYWQVDDATENQGAILWADNGTGTKKALSGLVQTPTAQVQEADISSYRSSEYLFYVELVNYSTGEVTQQGYKWGYGDLVSSGYVSFDARDIPTARANAIALGNFANVPEPSSGLLLLMGGAMLALRRRRQK